MIRRLLPPLAALALLLPLVARAEFIDMWAKKDDVGEAKAPRLGRSRVLVVPVEVKNAGLRPLDRESLVRFFEEPAEGVFRFPSYFQAVSSGRYRPEATVAPTVVFDGCPAELDGQCSLARGDVTVLQKGVSLLRTIFDRADRGCFQGKKLCDPSAAVDFSQFDVNGLHGEPDGYADGVLLVTNMPDIGIALPIFALNPAAEHDLAGGRGGSFLLDEVKVGQVGLCGDPTWGREQRAEYVCVHEFGHLLGLADLYQEPSWGAAHPEKAYDGLECSSMGSWLYDDTAMLPDAESRYRLGWTDVEVVSGVQRITLKPAASGGHVLKLGVQKDGRREYYLVEARGPVGPYDRGLVRSNNKDESVYGLAVYHVDWAKGPTGEPGTFLKQVLSCLNCDPWHPFIQNVQADRRWDLQQSKPFRPEDDLFGEGDLFVPGPHEPLSERNLVWGSNWYDGTPSGIEIRNIEVNRQNGFVTADFIAPEVADPCADLRCGPGEQCVAGNCRPPEQREPGRQPKPLPPPKDPPEYAWGCTAQPAGALALLALVALRRRRVARSERSGAA